MRPRRRRSHFRRQIGVTFQPGGGVLIDPGAQGGIQQSSADGQQQPFSTSPGNGISSTQRAQPAHHAVPTTGSQLPNNGNTFSSVAVQQTSLANVGYVTSSAARPGSSVKTTSLVTSHSYGLSSSASASESGPLSASHSSASASPSAHVSADHSLELYGGIALIAVFSLACIISFAAWLIRSRRRGSMCCCGSREDDDIENQDPGLGLGLYLDKREDSFNSRKVSLMPSPEPTRSTALSNPPALMTFQSISDSLDRYPTVTPRPSAAHLLTDDSVRTPSRLLGPLQVKNYVSGDFPSSGDEAVPTTRHGRGVGTPREQRPGGTPRFLSSEVQSWNVPWAPLNVKKSPAPNQVNIGHSASRKSETAQAGGDEDICPLPMPPFEVTQSQKDCARESTDGWGATFRSTLCSAISGFAEAAQKPEEDNHLVIPGSYSRTDRSHDDFTSQKPAGAKLVAPDSLSSNIRRVFASPKTSRNERLPNQPGHSMNTFDSIGLALREAEQGRGGAVTSLPTIVPLSLSKKRTTETQRKRIPRSVKSRSSSRASSVYSPFAGAPRRSTKRKSEAWNRGMSSPMSLSARTRPEFLRQPTTGSVTSFSSEASEPSRALTDAELRAKRTMMLRARRRRGMGTASGSEQRLTERLAQTEQPPVRCNEMPE